MAGSFSRGYASQVLGLAGTNEGANLPTILQNELAEQAKNRELKKKLPKTNISPAAFDLIGSSGRMSTTPGGTNIGGYGSTSYGGAGITGSGGSGGTTQIF